MKTPSAADRRVQRTRRLLREALVELILERGWDAISVQDVCDRADVGRSTFYTHFGDKEDLLVGGLEDLRAALRARTPAGSDATPLGFVRGLVDHAHEQRRLFRAVIGKRSGHAIQQRFRRFLLDLVRDDLERVAKLGPQRDATVCYIAGALFELLIWSIDTRNSLGPAEIEQFFAELTAPALVRLGART